MGERCRCDECWYRLAETFMADEIAAHGAVPVADHAKITDAEVLLLIVHRNALYEDDPDRRKSDWTEWTPGKWIDHNGGGWTWHGLCGLVTHVAPLDLANHTKAAG